MFKLKPIEHLLSHTTSAGETIVLGMISQLKEVNTIIDRIKKKEKIQNMFDFVFDLKNRFYLEDPTGSLPLDLTETVDSFYVCLLSRF
jgi:hypothetical protein